MNTAKFVKKLESRMGGNKALYSLSVPYQYDAYDENGEVVPSTSYVVCSTANAFDHGWETMVFPADENGKVIDWGDLACRRGMDELDHRFALSDIGYELETDELKN